MSSQQTQDQPNKPRDRFRVLRWATRAVVLVIVLIGAGLVWIMDRPVAAPDWLRNRVAARIAQSSDAMTISFGQMVITVQQGWRPQVRLSDVEFGTATGETLFAMSELDASLAMRPLLEGKVQPRKVHLSGLFATLRRDASGRLNLSTSRDANAPTREAASLPELIEQVDTLFLRPEMEALTQLDVDAVTLRFEDARADRVWTVDGARLRGRRDGSSLTFSADLAVLGGGAGVATAEANYTSTIGETDAQFGVTVSDMRAQDVAAFTPALEWLSALRAPISGSLRSGVDGQGALDDINATLQIGEGVLQPTEETRAIPFTAAQAYFSFNPDTSELVFDEFNVDSAWGQGRIEGRAQLRGVATGRLEEMVGQFQLSGLRLNPPDLYPEPLELNGAELDFRLRPEPFQVDLGQLRIVDQDRSMLLDGSLAAAKEGWDLAVNGHMAEITPARLLELWPPGAAPRTRDWLLDNLIAGDLHDLEFAMRVAPKTPQPAIYFSFGFENAEVRYSRTLPNVLDGKGVASMMNNRFVVAVEDGRVVPPQGGDIDVAGSSFIIPDVTVKDGAPAVVRLRTDSPIEATLSLLDQEPLNVLSRSGLPVDLAGGRARGETTLTLPLKKGMTGADIGFDARAELNNVTSDKLVDGSTVAARALQVQVDNDGVNIVGPGQFDGIPVDVRWRQALGPASDGTSTVEAQVELSDATVRALNLGLPPGTISGRGTGTLQLDLAKGRAPAFRLTSNLRGVGMSIPALGWSKPRSSTGSLRVAGTLSETPVVDRLTLEASGLSADGRVSVNPGGGLQSAAFTRVKLGGWLDAPVRLIGRGAGVPPRVEVGGGVLDMRRASFGSGGGSGGSGQSGPILLALDRLQITDTIGLTGFRGNFSVSGGLQGEFSGRVNGAAAVTGEVAPQRGRSSFRIKSKDAGAVFKAAGLLKQARGGAMNLVLRPVGTAGGFDGTLAIENTRVKDAPAIAALFNALSVVGLLEQMGGQGLHFANVDAAFRLTPDRVTLTQASATGPSIGLSMDGTYDVNTSRMDMRGVFSPIYLINGVGSLLTRRGEGLIGFNFRLDGPAESPRVQVNPLSALTPSIFREIFRRPPPQVALEPGENPDAAPAQAQGTRPTQPQVSVEPQGTDR